MFVFIVIIEILIGVIIVKGCITLTSCVVYYVCTLCIYVYRLVWLTPSPESLVTERDSTISNWSVLPTTKWVEVYQLLAHFTSVCFTSFRYAFCSCISVVYEYIYFVIEIEITELISVYICIQAHSLFFHFFWCWPLSTYIHIYIYLILILYCTVTVLTLCILCLLVVLLFCILYFVYCLLHTGLRAYDEWWARRIKWLLTSWVLFSCVQRRNWKE